ncbi:phytanoyl-CoA dioxygenase family protein [Croceicoccus gelatinilyticus]|uniref:phytanoyl-CoA dioxygenase family protein n=1 Tax=Croceicoccus gelatinilyticus TaxID=2835536 RepID=UPI001BCC4AB4|nr:phytanoyl-CoA dioxygenase family protein [Croceicoccus gelatinilyticus]
MPDKSVLRWAKAPLWLLQIATGAKNFEKNGLIGSKALNRAGLHRARVRLAARLAARRRRRLACALPRDLVADFARDGFIVIENAVPTGEFPTLRDAILSYEAEVREMVQGDTVTRRMAIDRDMRAAIPALDRFLSSPLWKAATRYVASFDREPLNYIQAIVRSGKGAPDPQTNLHSDTFHSSMKAWLFLKDVAEDEGPFTYVPGSNRPTNRRIAWDDATAQRLPDGGDRLTRRGSFRIEESELEDLGLPAPRRLAVKANTLVIADTYGFHARGPSAPGMERVEIWAYSRSNPFLPFTGFDLTGGDGIADRRIGWLWASRDRLKRWVGQPWKHVGRRKIL